MLGVGANINDYNLPSKIELLSIESSSVISCPATCVPCVKVLLKGILPCNISSTSSLKCSGKSSIHNSTHCFIDINDNFV